MQKRGDKTRWLPTGNDETGYFSDRSLKRARARSRSRPWWDHFRCTVQAAEHAAYILIAVIHRVGWLVGLVGRSVGLDLRRLYGYAHGKWQKTTRHS